MSERRYDDWEVDLGAITREEPLGPCPGCGAALAIGSARHPDTGAPATGVVHPSPYCHYYKVTAADDIEREVRVRAVLS